MNNKSEHRKHRGAQKTQRKSFCVLCGISVSSVFLLSRGHGERL